jgi:hypothetical protein
METNTTNERYVRCHCCGEGFYTTKPHDPNRDYGFGTCTACHALVARSWAKHGINDRPMTEADAHARLQKFA